MESRFFLGTNSPQGFYSLFDDFVGTDDFLWVIKGGPGCGKSSFMGRIGEAAENAGLDVEYIHCSGDPASLDGIYIPEKKIAYVDGTYPHTVDAKYAGASSLYLDLSRFYDKDALRERLPEIMDITTQYKAHYTRAYTILRAASAMAPSRLPGLFGDKEVGAALRRAKGVVAREFGKTARESGTATHGVGRTLSEATMRESGVVDSGLHRRRFISAFTCEGEAFMEATVTKLCERIYTLDNDLGIAPHYLERICVAAADRRISAIHCPNPMRPEELEAVLLPSLSLGFLAISSRREYSGDVYRHVRLDAIAEEKAKQARTRYRTAAKQYGELLQAAQKELAEAKRFHDEQENIYNPYVDFDGIYALANEHIKVFSL